MRHTLSIAILLSVPLSVFAGPFEDAAKVQYETSSRFKPPPTWMGPKFELSRDYPPTEPAADPSLPWMATGSDFRMSGQEPEYMKRVLAYCLEGNEAVNFKVQDNAVRKWYHAPWMHFGPPGREPIRGLTSERPAPIKFLHLNQTRRVQNWAVGFYNAPGGYVLGRAWADPAHPNSSMPRFPVGTAVFKLLFTNATDTEVPYLKESVQWDAMINNTGPAPEFKILGSRVAAPVPMRLLQIDIAVRDSRADAATGWVFGTFVYNFALKQPGDTPWDRLMPVGIMWGNDHDFTPAPGATPGEAWVNPAAVTLLTTPNTLRTELGHQGRVNGPVDNPKSSCLSCHSTAQDKPAPIMFDRRNAASDTFYHTLPESEWFRNLKPSDPFKPGEKSLDFSLQLAAGIENFNEWKDDNFPAPPGPSPAPELAGATEGAPKHKQRMVSRGEEEEDTVDVVPPPPAPTPPAATNPAAPEKHAGPAEKPAEQIGMPALAFRIGIFIGIAVVVIFLLLRRKPS